MDSEIRTPVAPARRGVAMFIVLGAILLVTLFGAVALTLAQRDQTLSGDLNDIKSRDEAALSGLQMAINRLTADPEVLLSVLNSFVDQSYAKNGKPDSVWLSLDSSTTLRLLDKEPKWFALSNLPGNQTATKVQLVAVQHADTTSEVKLDSTQIYVTLRCLARGRRGDEKSVQATYRIHGITGDNKPVPTPFTIFRHSFYNGGSLVSSNMPLGADGEVYVGGTDGSYINSGADHEIRGSLQWNGDLRLNSKDSISVGGNLIVNGIFSSNGSNLRVGGNAAIRGGLDNMDGTASISVGGNLHIAGTNSNKWNSTRGIRVGKSLYYFPSNVNSGNPKSLVVGEDAWIVRSLGRFNINAADSFFVGGSLFFGDPGANHLGGYQITGGIFKVGGSLKATRMASVTVPGGEVGDSVQINNTLNVAAGKTLSVGTTWQASTVNGTVLPAAARSTLGTVIWKPSATKYWPTLADMGISDSFANTTKQNNPMDSVKVDGTHSPKVDAAKIDLTGLLGGKITGTKLNQIYDSLKLAKKLLNDYLVGFIPSTAVLDIPSETQKFRGKMILVIEGRITVNGMWPASQTKANTQVLLVRNGGSLGNFGWNDTLAGIVYWENPCGKHNLQITKGVLLGAMLFGTSLQTPDFGYTTLCTEPLQLTPNKGTLNIVRDTTVFMDIGRGLPGVLVPALDGNNNPIGIESTFDVWYYTPRLRLVHDRPFFEPLGVFR